MPLLIITPGDPSGIGPEVAVKSFLKEPGLFRGCLPVIVGDFSVLKKYLKPGLKYRITKNSFPQAPLKNTLNIVDLEILKGPVKMGHPDKDCGAASIKYIDFAVKTLQSAYFYRQKAVLVTAPISKEAVIKSGIKGFSGHTEYLAKITGKREVAMLMVSGKYRVLLATRHIPLESVSSALTKKLITSQAMVAKQELEKYLRQKIRRVVMCGLNPHCGEGGHIGKEEHRVIIPAMKELRKRGIQTAGPVSAEHSFACCGKNDMIVCHYHDQAMVPLRLLCGMKLVNVTCGLDFMRVSPAHGTAFDIAGKNKADPAGMIEAIKFASGCN
ncbi:MAG: 4-hydroxythreonine-4-phosphate dehydrogenase PdxA [Elusimicrobia bacterium RIFOXYB2_FULL_48_7]|nr:MAG: 4-hydroxythreonine-4-phosphate dehydrogenase PdxA [Elusimicrobia bacterium RIFOXYB2_FULL_48_7]